MATWQIVLFVFFVLLPFALLIDFWAGRERLDFRGRPVPTEWRPTPPRPPSSDDAH